MSCPTEAWNLLFYGASLSLCAINIGTISHLLYIKSLSEIWRKINLNRFCFAMLGTAFCLITGMSGAVPIFQRWVVSNKISVIIGMGAFGAATMSALAAIERYVIYVSPSRQKKVKFASRSILVAVLMFTFAANARLRIQNASDVDFIRAGIPLIIIPVGHVLFGGYAHWKTKRNQTSHQLDPKHIVFRAMIIVAWVAWSVIEFTKVADPSNRAFALALVLLLETRIFDTEIAVSSP